MATETREQWHRTRGARMARAGLPKGTREGFTADGWPAQFWRDYSAGYEAAFEAMSPEQRKAVATGYYDTDKEHAAWRRSVLDASRL